MLARLALADGSLYRGYSFGAEGQCEGEVVFNTSMTGYQEIMTDPSYCGQIVTMTYPLIGNYGINPDDFQSRRPFVRAMVVREACGHPSNWRATESLSAYLQNKDIIGMSGVDTRELARRIRQGGTPMGIISTGEESDAELIAKVRKVPPLDYEALLEEVTSSELSKFEGEGPTVVIVDLGVKRSIVRGFHRAGCEIIVAPMQTPADEILIHEPDGVLFSNGPGDPAAATDAIATARNLLGRVPLFGICLGLQVVALALGARTFKLPYGHRGANHPVKDLHTDRVQITSQNHGYALADNGLSDSGITVTHRSLNDDTVEGITHEKYPVLCVQYHPEAFPGPDDSAHIFHRFLSMMSTAPEEATNT